MKAYKYNIKRIVFFSASVSGFSHRRAAAARSPLSSQNFSENSMEVHFLDVETGDST